MRARRRGERGTSMIELAFILPVFLMMVLGLSDFGRAVFTRNALANAARDGARFASVDPNNTACIASVAAQRSSLARLAASNVDVKLDSAVLGRPVTVSVQSQYQPITPLIEDLIGAGNLTLRGSATMRIRNVPAAPLACPTPASVPTATPAPPTATPVPPTATPCVGPPGQCKKGN